MTKLLLVVVSALISQATYAVNRNEVPIYFDSGVIYYDSFDYTQALKSFIPLAEHGDIFSQYYLGTMYQNGRGVEKDYVQAIHWYRKAAEQGHARAQSILGNMYFRGIGVESDEKEGLKWSLKAARQGDAEAQSTLGYLYGNNGDQTRSLFWRTKAAQQGDAIRQYQLAEAYYYLAKENPRDKKYAKQSFFWAKKAASQRLAIAEMLLALNYHDGIGTNKNLKQAKYWLDRSASQGNITAASTLGWFCDSHSQVCKTESVIGLVCKAAKLGDFNSIHVLFRSSETPNALNCLQEIASAGNSEAQYTLGMHFDRQNELALAHSWLRKSGESGNGSAMAYLGHLYTTGRGVVRDPVIARALNDLANRNDGDAQMYFEDSYRLSPAQIAEAEMLTTNWKRGMPLPDTSLTGRQPESGAPIP